MSEENSSTKTIEGLRANIDENRYTWAAKVEDGYLLLFHNNGMETRLKLSSEAVEALLVLLLDLRGHAL